MVANFLRERLKRTVLDGKNLEWVKVSSGVLQGSVLGPILFVSYVNDIVESIQSELEIFADDTKI